MGYGVLWWVVECRRVSGLQKHAKGVPYATHSELPAFVNTAPSNSIGHELTATPHVALGGGQAVKAAGGGGGGGASNPRCEALNQKGTVPNSQ